MAFVAAFSSFATQNISLILVLIVVILLGYLILLCRPRRNLPPGPRRLPLIGNLLDLRGRDIRDLFAECRRKYGDVFSLQIFHKVFIVVSGYETLKDMFVKHGDKFSDRSRSDVYEAATYPNAETAGILFASGPEWKNNRRFCLHHLRNFGMGKTSMQTKIHKEAEMFISEIEKHNGEPFDARILVMNVTSNIICSIVFGHRFDYDDAKFQSLLNGIRESAAGEGNNILLLPLALKYVPGDPFEVRKCIKNFVNVKNVILSEIQKHKDNYKPGVVKDMIDVYLDEWKRSEDDGSSSTYSDVSLAKLILELFGAGTETTSGSVAWFLVHMLRNRDVQEQIQAELDKNIPDDRLPNMDDKKNLVNMEAAFLELLRLSPSAPYGLPHQAAFDTEFRGHNIPCDAIIMPNLLSVLHDGDVYKDPEVFRPSRFITDDGIVRGDEHIPFSLGRRVCIGENLAKMELFLFLSTLLQRYHILPPEGSSPPTGEGVMGVTYAPHPFKVRFVNRRRTAS